MGVASVTFVCFKIIIVFSQIFYFGLFANLIGRMLRECLIGWVEWISLDRFVCCKFDANISNIWNWHFRKISTSFFYNIHFRFRFRFLFFLSIIRRLQWFHPNIAVIFKCEKSTFGILLWKWWLWFMSARTKVNFFDLVRYFLLLLKSIRWEWRKRKKNQIKKIFRLPPHTKSFLWTFQ